MQQLFCITVPVILIVALLFNWYILALLMFIIFGFIIWGIFDIRLSFFIPVRNSLKTNDKVLTLTFDDGIGEHTLKVLDILNENNIKATFFVIGANVEKYPHILQQIYNEGHLIGLHTQNHKVSFPFSGLNTVRDEIKANGQLIKNLTGITPDIFRPPFGITNPVIGRVVREQNLKIIGWSIRSLDTKIKDETRLFKRIIKRIRPGSIVLLHDTIPLTIKILPELIRQIQQKGYKFVPLS